MAANPQAAAPGAAPSSAEGLERFLAKLFAFGADKRIELYERFAEFNDNGKDVLFALRRQLTRFRDRKAGERFIWGDFVADVTAGQKFSRSIGRYIPASERLAIAAGEQTGKHSDGFRMAAYIARSISDLTGAIKAALIYPGILLTMFIILMYFVSWKMVPAMTGIAPVEEWPLMSYSLYVVSRGVDIFGVWVISGAILTAIAVQYSFERWTGPLRLKFDKFSPPHLIYRKVQGAMFVVILASMQRGGIPLDTALREVKAIASPWMKEHIESFQRRLSSGRPPSIAINTGLLDRDTLDSLEDYDEAGSFSKALEIVGRSIVKRTIASVSAVAKVIGFLLMVGVAGGIIWTYGSMAMLVMSMQTNTPSAP